MHIIRTYFSRAQSLNLVVMYIIPTALMLLVRNYFNRKANSSYLVSLGEGCRRFPSRD